MSYSPLTGSGSVSFEVRVAEPDHGTGADRGAVLLLLVVFWLAQPQLHIRSGLGAETEMPGAHWGNGANDEQFRNRRGIFRL